MAVYKRTYKRYEGSLTNQFWRFTVLPRYSLRTAFESKILTSFFSLCFLPHVIAVAIIYILNNQLLREYLRFNAPGILAVVNIDGQFFYYLFAAQTFLSFFLIAFIGPGLVSPDLSNNALPLYLCRPFTRSEYVFGKLAVLVTLTSLITWVPGLLLVGIQTDLAGLAWLWDHARIPIGIILGSLLWILTVSLIALALSAWVKSKPIAIASMFGVFFMTGAFGQVINEVLALNPRAGSLLNLPNAMRGVWNWLLLNESTFGQTMSFRRVRVGGAVTMDRVMTDGLPAWAALIVMLTVCAIAISLLARKVRAVEVVR